MRKVHKYDASVLLPRRLDEVFAFFSDAHNLETLTPPWLRFEVITQGPIEMRQGTIIDYKLRIRGIPIRWQSEITVWEPPFRFVDEQRRGPYSVWVHEHRFREIEGHTVAEDHIDYAAPGGALIHRWIVRRDIEQIFDFRKRKMRELFGSAREATSPQAA